VNDNWPMQAVLASGVGSNPFENTVNVGNVGQLTDAWSKTIGSLGNPSPFIEFNGRLFAGDVLGTIYSYSATGTLLWTASPGANFQSSTPAAYGALVYFGGGTTVYAYKFNCRADGGVCAPSWSTNIGTNITSSLTIDNRTLYAPGADGAIHPLNATTGVAGTPFAAFASSAAATSPVSFGLDGSYYYAEGSGLAYGNALGASGVEIFGGSVSAPATTGERVFFTTGDGYVHSLGAWAAVTSGTACYPAPAVVGHIVYAGGCSTIGAYEAGTGQLQWSIPTTGQVIGLSVANGVLYGCVVNSSTTELFAYNASYGGLLWSGGGCTTAPVVANGAVYGALGTITAYTLPGLSPTAVPAKPAPFMLRPNFKLVPQRTPNGVSAP
jgi:hypothetical protein